MSHSASAHDASPSDHPLTRAIDRLAPLLPAQGPISIFIHHNTLHAFEHLPFEEAVERAARQLGREPFLAESRYREKLASGRILAKDVEALLIEHLGARGARDVAGVGSRLDLWRAIVLHGIPAAVGRELLWILEETAALSRVRTDVPASARDAWAAVRELDDEAGEERRAVHRLWNACVEAVGRTGESPLSAAATPVRHRDWLWAVYRLDTDAWIHPPLIRFLAGYLDQGLAHWAMPDRSLGIHGCFLEIYRTSLAAQCGRWARTLPRLVAEDHAAERSAIGSIANSLAHLGVAEDEYTDYLSAELLALRGWAGIVRQIEERPDRVPARDLTVTLRGYLAVRLLFERAALDEAARRLSFPGPLTALRSWLRDRLRRAPGPTTLERAWPLFHIAQLQGLDPSRVEQWTARNVEDLESELHELDGVRQRRILHQAFERAIRHRLYDALTCHSQRDHTEPPAFQAVFCLDEREESFRRHLEEVEPACETFGAAGFFNVAMYHQGVSDAHPRPLCPVAIRPDHYVAEIEPDGDRLTGRSRRLQRRAAGFLGYNVHLGSRLPVQGAVLMTAFGWLALVPLVLKVVFPWLSSRWSRVHQTSITPSRTRLQLNREDAAPPIGRHSGFTAREMADIVRRVLEDIGIRGRLSPLVIVIGHGLISLNNPHESAHDCGACGGGRGGPNARAFSQMANDPRVRHLLADEGLSIDATTWFVGAQRNTCDNGVTFFDEDLIPAGCRPLFERAVEAIETARRREAHERCRRFDAVPRWYPPLAALAHVQGRAADLAQPRPEYGHATNAFCVIGRRARTRGLFLDRRAFLVSYDPARDDDGAILARIMAAVVPVVAGISLEYYFSYVDPSGYGCGTKLPHNVTSLLGVMDGAQSDLRTGLPWQMVEIHEPTRLAIVVEGARDRVWRVVHGNPDIERLVRNRWIWLACLDAGSAALWELQSTGFVPRTPEHALAVVAGDSAAWYQGKRGFIPPVAIVPDAHSHAKRPSDSGGAVGMTASVPLTWLVLVGVGSPAVLLALLGGASLVNRPLPERWTGSLAAGSMAIARAALSVALVVYGMTGTGTQLLSYGAWSASHAGGIGIEFLVDRLSLGFAALTTAIAGVVSAFSNRYLHRESGYNRYFVLLAMFVTGMLLVALAGNVEGLFIGWEFVGLSSALLVAFFHERPAAVSNAFRVLSVYRISDAAMLSAAVLLRHVAGTDSLSLLFGGAGAASTIELTGIDATIIAVLLIVAVAGKSALLPFSSWLPRAMEGPTPSSAVYYGSLSIHAGCFLLLRSAPLLEQAPAARVLAGGVGAATALFAGITTLVQSDVKSSLAYASLTQVGIIVVEIAIGWYTIAFVHLAGHACFRLLQFLSAPNVLHDLHGMEDAIGDRPSPGGGYLEVMTSDRARRRLFLFALERGFLDNILDRIVVEPFTRLARQLTRLDGWLCDAVMLTRRRPAPVEGGEDQDE